MAELRDRVAVVTGGGHRLGAAITLALADAGCHVAINYRTSAAAAETTAAAARSRGVNCITVQADVARSADVARLLDTVLAAFSGVDILVAHAGAFRRTPIATVSASDWDAMLTNNLRATFLCARDFGLHMRRHTGGSMITLADVAGLHPWPEYLPYSIAKAGVIALTRALARELAPTVRVNAVAPGPVLFPDDFDPALRQREVQRTLLRRAGDPANVADAVVALARNDYITGVVLPVDGGRSLT